jgi:predicted transglutaminase-like protease
MIYVIQLASRIRTERPDPARKLSANLYDINHCCVYSEETTEDVQRNCLKRVKFYSKNKFEKIVHLVGSITRIYHDARSPERQAQLRL